MASVTIYGANWCGDTVKARQQLNSLAVGFHYVNVDVDPMGQEEVRELNQGKLKIPTVVVEGKGTRILFVPDERELWQALVDTRLVDPTVHQA